MSRRITDGDNCSAARVLMCANFLGLSEVESHFRDLTGEERTALAEIPERLMTAIQDENVRRDYILVADIGLSILDVRSKAKQGLFCKQDWYDGEEFARRNEKACWRLIRK